MVKNITKINDFGEIIENIFTVECLNEKELDTKAASQIIEKVTLISEPILNCSSEENAKSYSNITLYIVEELKKSGSAKEIKKWVDAVRELLAIKFIIMNMSNSNANIQEIADDKTEHLLVEFFKKYDSRNICGAYVLAVMRFAHKDAKFCYDEIMNSFENYPTLFSELYNNISYVYSPDLICDTIFDSCPICGGSAIPYYCATQAYLNDNGFSPAKLWMKCEKCSNLYAYNFPINKNDKINGHYTKKNDAGILDIRTGLYNYCNIFNGIKVFNKGRKYLEIGIGNGEMLAVALEMGYDVSAVEICKEDCENISNALGVDVVWSDFADYETENKYDVIIMGDVLEHVIDPINALKKAYSMLAENGVLWLSTPNYNSAFTRMRKFIDPMWNQKNHFTYFSYDGLEPFLNEIGFSVRRYDVSNRYNGSMELILQK